MAQIADKLWTLEEFLAFMTAPIPAISCSRPARREIAAEPGIIPVNRRHSWHKADLPMMNLYHGILP